MIRSRPGRILTNSHQAIPRDLSQAEIAAIFYPIETRKTGAENP